MLVLAHSLVVKSQVTAWAEEYKDPFTLAKYQFVNAELSQKVTRSLSVSFTAWTGVYDSKFKESWIYKNINLRFISAKTFIELSLNPEKADEYNQAVYLTSYLNINGKRKNTKRRS